MSDHTCASKAGCDREEVEVLVFRGSAGRVWFTGFCELHEGEHFDPPAGFELYGGGGDPEVVREVFGNGWL